VCGVAISNNIDLGYLILIPVNTVFSGNDFCKTT